MPENLLCMQLSHIRYANMDFFKTPHIQIQLLGKDPVFKYEFLVLFIYPCIIKFTKLRPGDRNKGPSSLQVVLIARAQIHLEWQL